MQTDKIQGHKMTDMESIICEMNESDRAFQRVVDALNEIGCMSFMFTKEEYGEYMRTHMGGNGK